MPTIERAASLKYLTFKLAQETYGLRVLQVKEIIRLVSVTPVPQMPSYIKGVINLRGRIIPVIDLHAKFGVPGQADSARSCIIVVQIRAQAGAEIHLGLMVDDVQEVAQIDEADIEKAPDFGSQANTDYIQGIAKLKDRVAILLDIDQALTGESLGYLSAAREAVSQQQEEAPVAG